MPPNRRLCSLASGIVTIFFCLSFIVDQLDPRRGFDPEVNPFSADSRRPQTLLSLWNMTPNIQAQSSNFQARAFQVSRQTPSYYSQGARGYQRGYNLQPQDAHISSNIQAQGGVDSRQAFDSYSHETQDSKEGSYFHPHRGLNSHQQLNSYPQGLENSPHGPYSHTQQGFLVKGNSQSREPRHLANPPLSSNSQTQGYPNQSNSYRTSNSQPKENLNSPYVSNSETPRPLNSEDSYHTSQEILNPLSPYHGASSQTQAHQPVNSQPQPLQAQALQQIPQSQLLHTDKFPTRPHPHPRSITPTPTPIINLGLNLPSSSPIKQPASSPESALSQPSRSAFTRSSTGSQSLPNRGHGQCKKKYWKCDSPPTDPEPPLEDLQELEDLPSHPFTAPHWSQYANRGYTVVDRNESASKRLPDVLIIGAKKSGTRALLAFLRVHPSIKASGPELHYFDRFYARGLQWYRSKLPLSLEGQLTVEKTPAYFTTPGVPARVKQDLPSAKLLLVVRDPVTRALSDYTQSLSKHRSRRPFEELAFVRASPGLVNSEWGPISGGLYARHLQRWMDYFPRASIHVVSGENLIRDPAAELCKVQEFLGLRRVITEKHFFFNVTKGFPCLVKREKTGRPHCLGSSKGRSHPTVSQATLNTLRDFYRPFNFKFYKMVGQNFRW